MPVIDQMAETLRALVGTGEKVFWLIALRRVAMELDTHHPQVKYRSRRNLEIYRSVDPADCD